MVGHVPRKERKWATSGPGRRFRRGHGAHPAPLRRDRPARSERAQPRRAPALQRRRPRPVATDPVLPGAELPARRGRGLARRPGGGPARAPAPPARAADRPDREAAEDGRGRGDADWRYGTMGINLTPEERFEVFGGKDPEEHAEEAERRWGGTAEYAESQRRAARYTKDDGSASRPRSPPGASATTPSWKRAQRATGEPAMDMAEEHRQHIGKWFYDCSYEHHGCLGAMYGVRRTLQGVLRLHAPGSRRTPQGRDHGERGPALPGSLTEDAGEGHPPRRAPLTGFRFRGRSRPTPSPGPPRCRTRTPPAPTSAASVTSNRIISTPFAPARVPARRVVPWPGYGSPRGSW